MTKNNPLANLVTFPQIVAAFPGDFEISEKGLVARSYGHCSLPMQRLALWHRDDLIRWLSQSHSAELVEKFSANLYAADAPAPAPRKPRK